MRLVAISCALFALLVCVSAFADTIELKNGDKIDGKILEESETAIRIETPFGILNIPRSEISKITKSAGKTEEPAPEKSNKVIIKLTNGDKIEGEIIEESDSAIKIKTAYGPLTIPRSQIAEVSRGAAKPSKPSGDLLEKRKALADKHYETAMWAKENGLEDRMKENLEAAIKLCPDHEKARAALGFVKKDGEWVKGEKPVKKEAPKGQMTPEELMAAHQQAQQHLQASEYAKALEIYGRILKSYPDDLTANYNTACLLSLDKKIERALKFLEHAIRKARQAMDTGTWEEQQGAKSILDLLGTDTDLDNLRETDRFKKILRIAKGEKTEPEKKPEEPEKKPADPEKEEKPKKPKKKQRDF